jgi:hypothetical protein
MSKVKTKYVIGPDGTPMTAADLPAPNTKRWVIKRKAQLILAVRGGLISKQEVMQRYRFSEAEFARMERQFDQHGMAGLRVTHLQEYRK